MGRHLRSGKALAALTCCFSAGGADVPCPLTCDVPKRPERLGRRQSCSPTLWVVQCRREWAPTAVRPFAAKGGINGTKGATPARATSVRVWDHALFSGRPPLSLCLSLVCRGCGHLLFQRPLSVQEATGGIHRVSRGVGFQRNPAASFIKHIGLV